MEPSARHMALGSSGCGPANGQIRKECNVDTMASDAEESDPELLGEGPDDSFVPCTRGRPSAGTGFPVIFTPLKGGLRVLRAGEDQREIIRGRERISVRCIKGNR
jgi:hypothetical protein